jgi:hypothetical protein
VRIVDQFEPRRIRQPLRECAHCRKYQLGSDPKQCPHRYLILERQVICRNFELESRQERGLREWLEKQERG